MSVWLTVFISVLGIDRDDVRQGPNCNSLPLECLTGIEFSSSFICRYVNTSDYFDRCFVGCGPELEDSAQAFCGQLAAVYLFAQHMSAEQANCLYCLGPTYQSLFKHDAESNLPDGYKRHLFDGRLHQALVFAYSPKNCHGQLCLFNGGGGKSAYFVQVPHAVMRDVSQVLLRKDCCRLQTVEVITTHSIHNSLHSVGGIQMLLPLFAQIDMPHAGVEDEEAVDYRIW